MSKDKDIWSEENFDEKAEMSSMTIDWGKPEDYILGTFVKSRHNIETQYGTNSIYELVAEKGSYHKLIGKGRTAVPEENPTTINKGETWNVWGRGDIFNGQMNSLRPGQVVKITYAEDRDGANGPWKNIKIYAPRNNDGSPLMNQAWLDANSVPETGDFGNFEKKS